MFQKLTTGIFMVLFITALISCSSNTKLYEQWSNEAYSGPKLQKVLVIGVFKDDIKRRAFESAFVKEIEAMGKKGVAGYTLTPPNENFKNKDEILAAVKKSGADAVLITSFKGVIEKERDIPPRVDYVPSMGMRYGQYGYGYGYRGYYGSTYNTVYRPGYTVTDTIVQLDTRVFSVATEEMVWAGKTKSVNAATAGEIVKDLAKIVVSDMKNSGLIQ